MTEAQKDEILLKTKQWFKETLMENHIINTRKLKSAKEFNIHPFLTPYLASFLTGNTSPESIAKALIYPRALGTSITTSFGTNIQTFTTRVLDSFASTTSGIDIEFIDVDGRKKYVQVKSGPNCINKDDIKTIVDHFKAVKNLARTNGAQLQSNDLIVGVIYGEEKDLNAHYKKIITEYDYPVLVGEKFWSSLTGDAHFYYDLIKVISEIAIEADFSSELNRVITELANDPIIQQLSKSINSPKED